MGNRFRYLAAAALIGFVLLGILTCAKRDNPFDPLNYRETGSVCSPDSLLTFKTNALFLLTDADRSIAVVQAYADTMRADSSAKYGTFAANNVKVAANQTRRNQNSIIESINRSTTDVDSLQPKSLLDTLTPIVLNRTYADTIAEKKVLIETIQLKAMALIANFESSCSGNKAALQVFNDSVAAIITADSIAIGKAARESSALLQTLRDSSTVIALYNAAIISENTAILYYNENIVWLSKTFAYPHLNSPDSLMAYLAAAVPGDTFIVDGELTVKDLIHFDASGTPEQPIVLMGSPKMTSVINATGGIIITNRKYISLVNLVIQKSGASGFKVENGTGSVRLENCIIRDNTLYGVEAIDSDLGIVDCKIMRNGKSGLRFAPTTANEITLDNVLIVKNHGHGMELVSPSGNFKFITISNNDSSGINIPTFNHAFSIDNSLITYNHDYGIKATIQPANAGLITLRNDNFFGNPKGDIDTTGHYSYYTLEPGYADTASDNFSVNPNGPLQGVGIIGYTEKK